MKSTKTDLTFVSIVILLAILAISIIPGEGMKAASDTEAIVATDYMCATAKDCPVCVGSGIIKPNATSTEEPSFLQELSMSSCVNGKCELSDACWVWSCGNVNTLNPNSCKSVRQTLLDNTLGKINENPMLFFLILFVIIIIVITKGDWNHYRPEW